MKGSVRERRRRRSIIVGVERWREEGRSGRI